MRLRKYAQIVQFIAMGLTIMVGIVWFVFGQ